MARLILWFRNALWPIVYIKYVYRYPDCSCPFVDSLGIFLEYLATSLLPAVCLFRHIFRLGCFIWNRMLTQPLKIKLAQLGLTIDFVYD